MTTATAPDRPSPRVPPGCPAILLLALIWGSSFLFIKVGVRELHPLYVTLGRAAVGCGDDPGRRAAVTRHRLPRDRRLWGHLRGRRRARRRDPVHPVRRTASSGSRRSWPASGTRPRRCSCCRWRCSCSAPSDDRPPARSASRSASPACWWCSASGTAPAAPQLIGQLMCFGAALCYGFAHPVPAAIPRRRGPSRESRIAGRPAHHGDAAAGRSWRRCWPERRPPRPPVARRGAGSVLALGALGTGIAFASTSGSSGWRARARRPRSRT